MGSWVAACPSLGLDFLQDQTSLVSDQVQGELVQ